MKRISFLGVGFIDGYYSSVENFELGCSLMFYQVGSVLKGIREELLLSLELPPIPCSEALQNAFLYENLCHLKIEEMTNQTPLIYCAEHFPVESLSVTLSRGPINSYVFSAEGLAPVYNSRSKEIRVSFSAEGPVFFRSIIDLKKYYDKPGFNLDALHERFPQNKFFVEKARDGHKFITTDVSRSPWAPSENVDEILKEFGYLK